jgi:hypothetical protein
MRMIGHEPPNKLAEHIHYLFDNFRIWQKCLRNKGEGHIMHHIFAPIAIHACHRDIANLAAV